MIPETWSSSARKKVNSEAQFPTPLAISLARTLKSNLVANALTRSSHPHRKSSNDGDFAKPPPPQERNYRSQAAKANREGQLDLRHISNPSPLRYSKPDLEKGALRQRSKVTKSVGPRAAPLPCRLLKEAQPQGVSCPAQTNVKEIKITGKSNRG